MFYMVRKISENPFQKSINQGKEVENVVMNVRVINLNEYNPICDVQTHIR